MANRTMDHSVIAHPAWIRTVGAESMLERLRPFTMVARPSLLNLANQVRVLLATDVPGNFVECGVWRGGAAFLIADLLRRAEEAARKVWLFDSFEGLPPPADIDGTAANQWASEVTNPSYRDNLRVSAEEVQQAARSLGLEGYTELAKGWFEQSLSANRDRVGPIALLRVDADWHASVLCCLENLFDQVVDGGLIILDDYYTWSGCAVATHQFLGARRLGFPIESPLGATCGMPAVIRKGETTWSELWRQISQLDEVRQRNEQLVAAIPRGQTFIHVGQDSLGDTTRFEWRIIPFLERDGEYWGEPEDDATAIRELERLRAAGAGFIVFSSSAFWWLDYYAAFARHLRERFECTVRNDHLIVFNLAAPFSGGGR
jgi:O-methyltransferase